MYFSIYWNGSLVLFDAQSIFLFLFIMVFLLLFISFHSIRIFQANENHIRLALCALNVVPNRTEEVINAARWNEQRIKKQKKNTN